MLILLLISNIGFIVGSITRTDVAKLGRRLKNVTLSDYPDYEPEPSRSVSFPDIHEDRIENVPSSQVEQRTIRRRPQAPKLIDGQTSFTSANGNDNISNNWQAQAVNFVPYGQSGTASEGSQPQQRTHHSNRRMPASVGYSYAGYIERQAKRYPIMMYTLVQCIPCQRAKHLLAVSYADVAAHFLEFAGHEDWQRQLSVDLIRITGQDTFPYIFICGQNIGGASDLFQLHQSGQLRSTLNNCT